MAGIVAVMFAGAALVMGILYHSERRKWAAQRADMDRRYEELLMETGKAQREAAEQKRREEQSGRQRDELLERARMAEERLAETERERKTWHDSVNRSTDNIYLYGLLFKEEAETQDQREACEVILTECGNLWKASRENSY